MTLPRRLLPGSSYLITRRCIQRQFLLTPDRAIKDIFLFCLAHAAKEHGIEVHVATCLSNHFHLVVTDVEARLPAFMHWLDLHMAKCVNAYRGRWGALFEPESYSGVELIESADVFDKMIYTLINPVKSGLVGHGCEWPGFRSRPEDIDEREYVIERPRVCFSARGPVPEEVRLTFVRPRHFGDRSAEDFRETLGRRYRDLEGSIRRRFDEEGRKFVGRRGVLEQDPCETPRSYEERRGLNPRIAAGRKWPRIMAIQELQTFRRQYPEALARYRGGDREVIFPAGTYAMRVRFGVRCRRPP